jgi:hypothetical protein
VSGIQNSEIGNWNAENKKSAGCGLRGAGQARKLGSWEAGKVRSWKAGKVRSWKGEKLRDWEGEKVRNCGR